MLKKDKFSKRKAIFELSDIKFNVNDAIVPTPIDIVKPQSDVDA